MLPIGHIGIGSLMVRPFWRDSRAGLSWFWIVIGTLLPDLIDKPLYYALAPDFQQLSEVLVSGTRTFGHALFFPVVLLAIAAIAQKPKIRAIFAAIALGVATHILLDHVSDALGRMLVSRPETISQHWPHLQGLLFPVLGFNFPDTPFRSLREHFGATTRVDLIVSELVGAFFIFRYIWLQRVPGVQKKTRRGSKPRLKRK